MDGSLPKATLCILTRGSPPEEVLLGFKKVGFGAGKYAGFGGKVETGESVTAAATRELEEETGIKVGESDLQHMGRLTFLFPARPAWSLVVHVFLADKWGGHPEESREMMPTWFLVNDLPFKQMWQDGRHWLPRILAGERIRAEFIFNKDNETIDEVHVETWEGGGR
jgi:8-oxo-dGTP pyrophosphatase MutT (NUDIX family)